ncbi:MAG: response regulator, partial [Xanthomonadales bacterium]|nr:response regulator [Xanthomonadales bacterium]
SGLTPFAEAHWPQLAAEIPKDLLALGDGRYALSFRRTAPWLLDSEGNILRRLAIDDGAPERYSAQMAEDAAGGLWIAQDRAVTRVDLGSGLTQFDENAGIASSLSIARVGQRLYVTTQSGLYLLQPATDELGAQFALVHPGIRLTTTLAALGSDLLVAGDGVSLVANADQPALATARKLPIQLHSFVVVSSRHHARSAFVGHQSGVSQILDIGGANERAITVLEVPGGIYEIVEEDAQTLWIANRGGKLWRVDLRSEPAQAEELSTLPGLVTKTEPIRPFAGRDGTWIGTVRGVRRYDAQARQFVEPPGMDELLLQREIFVLIEDAAGNLWGRVNGVTGVAWREGARYRWDPTVFGAADLRPTAYDFLVEDKAIWITRADGVLRLDLRQRRPLPPIASARLSAAIDSANEQRLALPGSAQVALDAAVRGLRLDFALVSPIRPEAIEFRSRLLGVDADWSAWSERRQREYSSLPYGPLRFELQARDGLGRESAIASFDYALPVPFLHSTAGRVLELAALALLVVGLGWLLARRHTRTLQRRQRELEAAVVQGTQDLAAANRVLAEQADRLREIDQLKSRFFENVGHEFRTPLTLVLGPLEDVLRAGAAGIDRRSRELLELALRNARRVLDLIVEMLDINRLEQGQMPIRCERLDLVALLRQQADGLQVQCQHHGHELVCTLPQHAVPADVDPRLLDRAIENLVGNAIKYSASGGCIELSLALAGERARISVADQGCGIAEQELPHVFDRFHQSRASDRGAGHGIGLSLVREIAEAMGGEVSVQSQLGVGSCFQIELPLAAQVAEPGSARVDHGAGAEVTGEHLPERDSPRILVVDDHADLRARVRQLLELRHRVDEAADGQAALRLVADQPPDLIVCDVMMPGMDGVTLVKRIRHDPVLAAVPLLLLTAKASAEHVVEGLAAGADGYMVKPFAGGELVARVDALLATRSRLQRALRAQAEQTLPSSSREQQWEDKLIDLVQRQLDESHFGVDQLAALMHLDRTQLFRRMKSRFGCSPSEYLREQRLQRAHQLLASRAGPVTEVAYAVGFESLSSFTRAFRSRYGYPPSETPPQAQRVGRD